MVSMKTRFRSPWRRASMAPMSWSRSACRASCSGVKGTVTVSGLRMVKRPMLRRRVLLIRGEKV
jgi:hypothetical protein